jgi:D-glycero-D-manno-heptose 1,7-bisphosphate phosphatase
MIVFLDRDGVILKPFEYSGKGYAITHYSEIEYYEGTKEALNKLVRYASLIFIVTNQPDLHSGKLTLDNLLKIHEILTEELPINEIFYCPHLGIEICECRKPQIGLFLEASKKWGLEDKESWMVGDRDIDIQAGRKYGCKTVFIDRGWKDESGAGADFKVMNLDEAVNLITNFSGKP